MHQVQQNMLLQRSPQLWQHFLGLLGGSLFGMVRSPCVVPACPCRQQRDIPARSPQVREVAVKVALVPGNGQNAAFFKETQSWAKIATETP